MTIYAYQYNGLEELRKIFSETKVIDKDDYRIMELEHVKSKAGKIHFINKHHRATQKRMLKKFLVLLACVIIIYFVVYQLTKDVEINGILGIFFDGGIIGVMILLFVWLKNLVTLSKSIIFEKHKIYSPMLISSHFYEKFDEIKLNKNENFNYALFYYKNKPIKKCIILLADNEIKTKTMNDFVKSYANKAGKKVTDSTISAEITHHNNI